MSDNGWVLTLAVDRRDAESLPELGDILPELADPPTLNVEEPDPARPDDWQLSAYFAEEPAAETVAHIVALFPSASGARVAPLPDADWTTLSQRDLEPVRAGRTIIHTAAHADRVRPGDRAIRIEAGLAFGTGQHATTLGCLEALESLGKQRRFGNIADIGTGTGVLALAAAKQWRRARTIATDIDPVSIVVTSENLKKNRALQGRAGGAVELAVAPGMQHARLMARAPYDLVLANILAPPLVAISRPLSEMVAPGGIVVLAGLLHHQARRVMNAYRRHGLVPAASWPRHAEWPCLVLVKTVKR